MKDGERGRAEAPVPCSDVSFRLDQKTANFKFDKFEVYARACARKRPRALCECACVRARAQQLCQEDAVSVVEDGRGGAAARD